MKVKFLLFLIMALFASCASYALQLVRGPYMTMATTSGVTIHWRTDSACNSVVKLGTSAGALINTVTNLNVVFDHVVTIQNLQPNTLYYYSIGTSAGALLIDSMCRFKTLPASSASFEEPIRFWVMGDMGKQTQQQINVRNAFKNYVRNQHVNGWILLGDNAYQNGLDIEYQQGFFNYYQQDILKNIVLWPALGNHDYANNYTYRTNYQIPYLDMFTLPAGGESGGLASGTRRYYSFNYGNVHFVNLDSYGLENVGGVYYGLSDTLYSPQAYWLKADLSANQLPWVIVSFHHPPYCMGTHNSDTEYDLVAMRTNLNPILERYNVDMVLSGHCHTYQRSQFIKGHYGMETTFDTVDHVRQLRSGAFNGSPNSCAYVKNSSLALPKDSGSLYVVVGSGSAIPQPPFPTWPHDAMYYSNFQDNGSLLLTIEGNKLIGEWISTDTTNLVKDQFVLYKNVGINKKIETQFPSSHTLKASWKSLEHYVWSTGDTSREIIVNAVSDTILTVADLYNCITDTFTITSIPLHVSEVLADALIVYPNPALEQFSILMPREGKCNLKLYTTDAKLVWQDEFYAKPKVYTFSVEQKGEYILELIFEEKKRYSQRIEVR